MLAPALAIGILAGYVSSLWWLLRRENPWAIAWLVGLTGLSTSLRLVYTTQYPNGMNEDEVKIFWCTVEMLRQGQIFGDDCTGIPSLLSVVFDAQLGMLIGPSRWAIRGLSFLGGTLAVPAAFAAARSLGLRSAASLAAAGLVAILPWSLFYGRVHQSGELVFETLLLAACLARSLRARGGWQEMLIGGFALTLLLQTYYSGRTMLGLTMVAVVLAPGRHRLFCVGIVAVAMLGYVPYYRSGATFALVGASGSFTEGEIWKDPVTALSERTSRALHALVEPVAYDQWLTIRAAVVHPMFLLVLAVVGSLTGVRRFLFLWAGFLGGLAPAIVGYGPLPSARRMLLGLPFVCLAVACALDLPPWRRIRVPACAAVFVLVAVWSTRFFFSTDFWRPESAWVFDAERWNVVESLPPPPHPRVIYTRDLGYYHAARGAVYRTGEPINVESLYPPNQAETIYVFGPAYGALIPIYEQIFGLGAVRAFGRTFTVKVDAGDWSWLRDYGWSYRVHCDDTEIASGEVPFLMLDDLTFKELQCEHMPIHVWSGRWLGPPSKLNLYAHGAAVIEVNGVEAVRQAGFDVAPQFQVETGATVAVRVEPIPNVPLRAQLLRQTPNGERAPFLEWTKPLDPRGTTSASR